MSAFRTSSSGGNQDIKVGTYYVTVKQRLAEGGFGFVDLVYESNSRTEFVLKRCGVEKPESLETVKKEIKMLQTFQSPNVVKVHATEIANIRGQREALILMEYCPGGHLLDRLNSRQGQYLPEANIFRIFGQLLMALRPFHENNPPVTHRDLKLENIIFGTDGNVRLCDFGSCIVGPVYLPNAEARAAAEEIIGKESTPMYRAPEMIDLYMRDVLTEKTDIWALGCIFFALCCLRLPFEQGSLSTLGGKYNIPPNAPMSEDSKTLLARMFDMDPEARPSVKELFDGFAALAKGQPLPPYEISEEAKQRKEDRRLAILRQEQKALAKKNRNAPLVPPRKTPVPLDGNSVAAKRLAAKKGITLPTTNTSAPPNPFESVPRPAAAHKQWQQTSLIDDDLEPITFNPSISSAASISNNHQDFDPFGTSAQQQRPNHSSAESFFVAENFDSPTVVPSFADFGDSKSIIDTPKAVSEQPVFADFEVSKPSSLKSLFNSDDNEAVAVSAAASSSSFDAFSTTSTAPQVSFDAFGNNSSASFAGFEQFQSMNNNPSFEFDHSAFASTSQTMPSFDAFSGHSETSSQPETFAMSAPIIDAIHQQEVTFDAFNSTSRQSFTQQHELPKPRAVCVDQEVQVDLLTPWLQTVGLALPDIRSNNNNSAETARITKLSLNQLASMNTNSVATNAFSANTITTPSAPTRRSSAISSIHSDVNLNNGISIASTSSSAQFDPFQGLSGIAPSTTTSPYITPAANFAAPLASSASTGRRSSHINLMPNTPINPFNSMSPAGAMHSLYNNNWTPSMPAVPMGNAQDMFEGLVPDLKLKDVFRMM